MAGGGDERRDPSRPAPATVLVVDDSAATRRIIGRMLEAAGHRVVHAADGQLAVDTCRADPPDLVLLDVDMPVMDGLTALRALKADPHLQGIPVLFLTARAGGSDVAAGLELGAVDYLRKPCEEVELTARVASVLRQAAQQRAILQHVRSLDDLSVTDPLTGVGNRRRLEVQIAELRRSTGPGFVGIVMLDVDHFKLVNDEHGHAVGDLVLRIVARRLATAAEPHTLIRWGGEEFVVLATDISPEALIELAERLRETIDSSPLAIGGDRHIHVTVSAGCASCRPGDVDSAMRTADERLYRAKREGRNRVVA